MAEIFFFPSPRQTNALSCGLIALTPPGLEHPPLRSMRPALHLSIRASLPPVEDRVNMYCDSSFESGSSPPRTRRPTTTSSLCTMLLRGCSPSPLPMETLNLRLERSRDRWKGFILSRKDCGRLFFFFFFRRGGGGGWSEEAPGGPTGSSGFAPPGLLAVAASLFLRSSACLTMSSMSLNVYAPDFRGPDHSSKMLPPAA
mmetsp:Transcript_11132/g.27350  ORF Transcript_11132/g.27350 Transcript_11132/m.27350 type:complete len:200 (+) Transcript_11132:1022-1621(+)